MKTMLSKLTSALLCLAMLLTMCSFAMAEAGTYTGVGDSEIGGKGAIEVSVTVDENGVVTGLTKGKATITATLKTEKRTWKASVNVTVARAVTDIAVNETSLTLYDAADPLISHLTGGADGRVLLLRKGKQVSIRRIRTWCV